MDPYHIKQNLKKSYQLIAQDFSDSRSYEWPEFKLFSSVIPEGAKILDLGCGNGRFLGFLLQQKKMVDYTGLDFCPDLLEIARKKYPTFTFLENDITDFHLSERFDRIVCSAAFHHIPSIKLRKKSLDLMAEHLKDDGLLCLSVWDLWQLKYANVFVKSFLKSLFSFFTKNPKDLFIPFGHQKILRYYHAFFFFELKRLLRAHSFSIEQADKSGHNFVIIARKQQSSPISTPIFVNEKTMAVS